ncbi:MAG: oxygen-dependent coproporphyrinogen oxidase [Flavobacteriales bacterium MED-G15]|nr:MAG: oxygen-dependent coproporphyrinogen oxidase [Flavobacteriales bacterium MED-G15]|tara:strand:- start:8187 stop:9089 length:903 start_codon:yes stop_codon:yes gene_type:complete
MRAKFNHYIEKLQDKITSKLAQVDGESLFVEDTWERDGGGGGRTRVIENGAVFEKGGVNISAVHGELPDSMKNYFKVETGQFFACGLSLVIHPKNPFVPTVHANWRYFELYNSEGEVQDQWFGGGQDLTPYYLFEEDAKHFHQVCKKACDLHDDDFYFQYKKKCDDYFWNAHRDEARGVGGLFFDYLRPNEKFSAEKWYDFVTEVGDHFLEAYVPIVEKRKNMDFSAAQRAWQEIRRGRYVEFNLIHDKGTLFGLKTNGRIESILMSLPPHVQWHYNHQAETNSPEEELITVLKNPREWV